MPACRGHRSTSGLQWILLSWILRAVDSNLHVLVSKWFMMVNYYVHGLLKLSTMALYLALAISLPLVVSNPCNMLPGKTRPWCDLTKSHDERVEALIADLTLAEKGRMISSFSKVCMTCFFPFLLNHVCFTCRWTLHLSRFAGGWTKLKCPTVACNSIVSFTL